MELCNDQVGANAAAETTDATKDGEEHHMPQLAFLDEDWRGTIVIIAPERSGLDQISNSYVQKARETCIIANVTSIDQYGICQKSWFPALT